MIALVTLTRGNERAKLLDQCFFYIQRMCDHYKANGGTEEVKHIVVDFKPVKYPDLAERWVYAMQQVKKIGAEKVVIIEDDDWYHESYLSTVAKNLDLYDVVGSEVSLYYHVKKQAAKNIIHKRRSSLFMTSFQAKVLDTFKVTNTKHVFIDLDLWEHVKKEGYSMHYPLMISHAIGIKHNIGKCGGIGHTMNGWDFKDPDLVHLEKLIGEDVEFYKTI